MEDDDIIDPNSHLAQPDPHKDPAPDPEADRERLRKVAEQMAEAKKLPPPREILFDPSKPPPLPKDPARSFDPLKPPGGTPKLNQSDPSYWTVDPDFGSSWGRGQPAAQAVRGLYRGAVDDTVYGLGQLSRLATQRMQGTQQDLDEATARMRRPQDELTARWGSPIAQRRAIEHQRPYQEPGWLTNLAKQQERDWGPESRAAKRYQSPSAGMAEATTRFLGPLALPFGGAKLVRPGLAGMAELAARGGLYGAIQPTEHGTAEEKAIQTGVGAFAAPLVGGIAGKFARVMPRTINEAVTTSKIGGINSEISAQAGQAAVKTGIMPTVQRLANETRTSVLGNGEAETNIERARKIVTDAFAKKPTLGGTEFSEMIQKLDELSGNLRVHGGKLSPEMTTAANGIDKMVAALENHVAQRAPEEARAAQQAAREEHRKLIEEMAGAAEKKADPETAGGVALWDLVKGIGLHRWHASDLAHVPRLAGRAIGSKASRRLLPPLAAGGAVRATQGIEEGQDEQK